MAGFCVWVLAILAVGGSVGRGGSVVAADMLEANEMAVGNMAVVAEAERKMISKRTKDGFRCARC